MKLFQIVLLAFFAVLIVVAVLIFSGIIPVGNSEDKLAQAPITMWGTMPSEKFQTIIDNAKVAGDAFNITYVQKNASTLEADLVNALASGVGPDLLLAPHTLVLKQID